MTNNDNTLDLDNLSEELIEWFENATQILLEAGWLGQELSINEIENEDGPSTIVFTWDENSEPVTNPLADKE